MKATERSVVVGAFPDPERARRAMETLKTAGFSGGDISLLMPTAQDVDAVRQQTASSTGQATAAGAVAGGVLGGLSGWLVGMGALAIPGIGPVLAAGALAAALGTAAIGAGAGAIGGALVGLGLSREEAEWYEGEVRRGATLVAVRPGERFDEAQRLLREQGAYDIQTRSAPAAGESPLAVEAPLHREAPPATARPEDERFDLTPDDTYNATRGRGVARPDPTGRLGPDEDTTRSPATPAYGVATSSPGMTSPSTTVPGGRPGAPGAGGEAIGSGDPGTTQGPSQGSIGMSGGTTTKASGLAGTGVSGGSAAIAGHGPMNTGGTTTSPGGAGSGLDIGAGSDAIGGERATSGLSGAMGGMTPERVGEGNPADDRPRTPEALAGRGGDANAAERTGREANIRSPAPSSAAAPPGVAVPQPPLAGPGPFCPRQPLGETAPGQEGGILHDEREPGTGALGGAQGAVGSAPGTPQPAPGGEVANRGPDDEIRPGPEPPGERRPQPPLTPSPPD